DNVVYHEWVPAGVLTKSLITAFSTIIVFGTLVIILVVDHSIENFYGLIFSWGILAFILFLFWNYRGLEIIINFDELSVNYGVFNKKSIKLTEIVLCQITKASFGRYGGSGVRYGFDGSTAYTTSFGNAVEIIPKEGRSFVFSSKNPEKICKIINTKTKS
ncbi:hypothetical protein ACFLRN_09310, partial [Thermoproteota archaeon]